MNSMRFRRILLTFTAIILANTNLNAADMPASVMTPDKVQTSLGTLEFTDGAPSPATVAKLYDNLDLLHGVNVFLEAFQGVSGYAIWQGFHSIGVEDNSVLIFSNLMDAKSLFLT